MVRYLEIDIIKGVAVILMVFFHIFYMMNNMGFNKINSSGVILKSIAKISHLTFITMAGLNFYISYKKNKNKNKFREKQLIRSCKLMFFAMTITYLSQITFGNSKSVKFGILHFMSVAIVISLFIVNIPTLIIGIMILLFFLNNYSSGNGEQFSSICKKTPFLCFVFGIYGSYNYDIGSLDHHSLLSKYPFFGIGMILGHLFYKNDKKRIINLDKYKNNKIIKLLTWLGKNSLFIYILHWIVLYGIIYICGGRPIK